MTTATQPRTNVPSSNAPASHSGLRMAYLVNKYPQTSIGFIRREINALEQLGVEVHRYTLRRWEQALVDPQDREELSRTTSVLEAGLWRLCLAALLLFGSRPLTTLGALRLALHMGWKSHRGVWIHVAYFLEACHLRRCLRAEEIQRVHAHFGTNATTVAMLCRCLGGPPYSFTVHGPEEFDRPELLGLHEKIARASFVVAVSEFGRSQLYRWSRFADWSKIHVVHCGVDERYLDALPSPVPERPRLVCVGRLHEQKGTLLLVQAAAQLAREGRQFELALIGDGPMREEVETLIERLGIGDTVELLGWKSNAEVRQEIVGARAFVLPSFAEGLPVVLMEALACHRPVVSTYVAGIAELVEPGVCGWLVPAGSLPCLVQALREVLDASTDELEQMGSAGARRVAREHDTMKEAAKLMKLVTAREPSAA